MSTSTGGPSGATNISNGLVFCIDAANQNSYLGYPTFSVNPYYSNQTGSYFYDLSGNGNHFSTLGRESFPPYVPVLPTLANNYLTFNGSNQLGAYGIPPNVGLTPNSFDLRYNRTWDALVYLASDWDTHTVTSGSGVIYVQGIGNDCQFAVSIGGNNQPTSNRKVIIGTNPVTGIGSAYSTSSLSAGTWNHICTVLNNQTMSIYINGTLDTGSSFTATYSNKGDTGTYIMANPNTAGPGFFKGRLSLMRMYSRSLTAEEVYQNYINVKSRTT
jgi:hypothetical protein